MKNKYELLGYCGIFCGTDCIIFQAANSDDIKFKSRTVKAISQELGIKIDISELQCKGCQGPEEEMWFECRLCYIRHCGKKQKIRICTDCKDHPCQVFKIRFSQSENAPKNLSKIRKVGLDHWIEKKLSIMCMIEASKYGH
ncbi:MAG: DUF3795 domain-containing protein [Promethearchaeota archaeon]